MSLLHNFVRESNRIEGIMRAPQDHEINAVHEFTGVRLLTIQSFEELVTAIQPGAKLRFKEGMDVRVGNWVPPSGGSEVVTALSRLISDLPELTPHEAHCRYLTLHPFMDGNGRSARALWLRMVMATCEYDTLSRVGFLHTFYYQTLAAHDERAK